MAKDFLEELNEELNTLMLSELERLREAVEKKERPPVIMTPAMVMRTVHRVAMAHNVTGDELMSLLAAQDLTGEYAAAVADTAARIDQKESGE